MKTYLLYVCDYDALERERRIDQALGCMGNAFQPCPDCWLFRSSLSLADVETRLASCITHDDAGEDEPWILLEVSDGKFGGSHPRGTNSHLKSLFTS